jgi:hypothetical protein
LHEGLQLMFRLIDFVVQSGIVCGLPWLLAWGCVAPIEWAYQAQLAEANRLNAENEQLAASVRNRLNVEVVHSQRAGVTPTSDSASVISDEI